MGEAVGHGRSQSRGEGEQPVLHNPAAPAHNTVLELLCSQPQRLEPGLIILDRRLALDEAVMVDVLGRDASGVPVAVLFCDDDLAQAIGRCAAVLAAIHQGRFLLDRLYGHAGLVAQQRPRFMLISGRFSAARAGDLLQLVGGCDVAAFESRVVQAIDGRPELHLHMLGRSDFGAAKHTQEAPAVQSEAGRPVSPSAPSAASAPAVVPAATPAPAPAEAPVVRAAPAADEIGHEMIGESNPIIGAVSEPATHSATASEARAPSLSTDAEATDWADAHVGRAPETAPLSTGAPLGALNERTPLHGSPNDEDNLAEEWRVPVYDDVDLLVRSEASPECRRLCLAARDSIRSLSSLVTQSIEPDRICFSVDKTPLATLIPRGDSLQLRVGDEGGPVFDVRDDDGYNASLNAIFSHYFSGFANRA